MAELRLDELLQILRGCAGEDGTVDLGGDVDDVPFATLGYDSLAMLETISQVELRYGVSIPDEAVHEMPTPRAALDYFNQRLAALTSSEPSG
jgi:act minimal PKS acyl carrier protein